jgi:PfaD family protein
LCFSQEEIAAALSEPRATAIIVRHVATGALGVQLAEVVDSEAALARENMGLDVIGVLPPLYPEWLGDRAFAEVHGCRFPYVTGAMANGIASAELVIASSRAGFLAFFGAAGLDPARIERELMTISSALDSDALPWGSNLIHNPAEPAQEAAVADLYIRREVRRVSAAAYMALTPSIVRYAYAGLHTDRSGQLVRPNHVFAKISHPTVARHFMAPAPAKILAALVADGLLTAEEARLGAALPVAEDIIVESDSGGHTDNRPLAALFPAIADVRDELAKTNTHCASIRLGAAGGLGAPSSVAAAYALGAAFVLTGTVNQACVESGLHQSGRDLLATADIADVVMAPAADMFEMGVNVQVLQRGTLFAGRAKKLFAAYRAYASLDDIPEKQRQSIEAQVLRQTFDEAWESTRSYWLDRDAAEIRKAESDPKHKMALVFRAYLGQSSRWAIAGEESRRADFQIWCGPAMGAFNRWCAGSFLESPANRQVDQVGLNLLEGAAIATRASQIRSFGVPVPASAFSFSPRPLA